MAKKKEDIIEALNQFEAKFGKGTIVVARDKQMVLVKDWIPSGSLALDIATGNKGIPSGGKTTCILGKESSSKTTLSLHIIAEDQKRGNLCAFLDVEDSLDLDYAQDIGVDLSLLHIIDRESLLKSLGVKDRSAVSAEEWLELLCKMLDSNLYGTVVLDSVAALQPLSEIQQGLQGGRIAGIASVMSRAYRAVANALGNSRSAFVYLNQYRMNPGNMYNPLTEPGGEAWRYLQDMKIEISKSLDKDSDGVYGIIVKGKISKSKVCNPFKTFEYYVEFGKGIQRWKEIMDIAIELEIIEKTGNTYHYEDGKIGVGLGQVEEFLKNNPELLLAIQDKVMEKLKPSEATEIIEEKSNIKANVPATINQ